MARILAVDDELSVRRGVAQLLRRIGHEVHEAPAGRLALRAAAQRSFDVAIVDYDLPELGGLSVLQGVRQKVKDETYAPAGAQLAVCHQPNGAFYGLQVRHDALN